MGGAPDLGMLIAHLRSNVPLSPHFREWLSDAFDASGRGYLKAHLRRRRKKPRDPAVTIKHHQFFDEVEREIRAGSQATYATESIGKKRNPKLTWRIYLTIENDVSNPGPPAT
jgi:hypothetical protein